VTTVLLFKCNQQVHIVIGSRERMRLGLERPEIETWTGEAREWDLD